MFFSIKKCCFCLVVNDKVCTFAPAFAREVRCQGIGWIILENISENIWIVF